MPDQFTAPRQEIAFIDASLADLQTLIAGMRPGITVVLLDPAGNGVEQIVQALAGRSGLAAIHLFGHGASGMLQLGELTIDAAYMKEHTGLLADIGVALGADGDILVYGCDTGAGSTGADFLTTLAETTGADVAGSDDASGGLLAGGDWELESTVGQVETASAMSGAAAGDYLSTLALTPGTVHTYSANTWAYSSLAQDAAGNIYLAHKLSSTAISLKQWTGSAWTELTQLTTAMTGDTSFSDDLALKVDASGNLDLMFRHAKDQSSSIDSLRGIKFGEFDMVSRSWTTKLVEQSSHPNGWLNYNDQTMAIDASGKIHVVYNFNDASVHDYYIKYATSADGGATWSTSTVLQTTIDGVDELKNPTVQVDSAGNVHLFYIREDNQNTYYGNLYHVTKAAGSATWSAHTKIADALTSAFTMTSDGNGHFYIGYSLRTADAGNVTTGSQIKILSNETGSWQTETALQDGRTNIVGGLQLANGKLHMLVNARTLDNSATDIYVMRDEGASWLKGYQGEAVLPVLSTQATNQYFSERTFLVKNDGTIMIVAEDGGTPNLRNIYFTSGSSDDFGLISNAAPVITGIHGDAGFFIPNAPDLVADGAYIDDQASSNALPVGVSDADGGDFNGGKITITRSAGSADGRFELDFANGSLAAGPDSATLGGTLRAGERIFTQVNGVWTAIGTVNASLDGQGGRDLVIDFTSAYADAATAEAFIKFLMYTAPTTGTRAFTLTVSDGDGGTSAPASFTMTGRDVVAPTVTGVSAGTADGARKIGDTVSIQVTFSEAVIVGGSPTLQLETGATDRNATYASGSGTDTLTFTYTVQAGDLSADLDVTGAAALQLNGGSIRDAAANDAVLTLAAPGAAGSLGHSKAIRVDGLAPTDISLSNASVTTLDGAHALVGTLGSADATPQDSFTYTLVAGAGASDNAAFEIVGGTLRAVDAGALSDGLKSVRVRTVDAAGNSYEEALAITVSSPPSVAISAAQSTLGVGGSTLITFSFTAAPVGFDAADVTVSGGSLGALTVDPQNAKVYTATFTPAAGVQNLAAAISVGAGAFTDANGMANVASSVNALIGGDTLAPTVTISADRSSFKAGQTATVSFTFSELPNGFDASDIVVTGGTLSGLAVSVNPLVHTATFTPSADIESLSGAIAIAAGRFNDAQGNANSAAPDLALGGDTRAPVVSDAHVTIAGASGANGIFVTGDIVTVSWDDSAAGDNNPDTAGASVDFSAFGGPASVAATQSGGVWSASWQITAGSIDATGRNVTVTALDDAGNSGTRADSSNAAVDNQAPTVTGGAIALGGASGHGGAYRVGDVVTATWNNAVDGNADVAGVQFDFSQFGGGQVAGSASGNTWSASYTIVAANIDAANRNVAVQVSDDAGNTSLRSGADNVAVDAILPHISAISVANSPAQNATSIDYTVVFDEAVSGVDLGDFVLDATGTAAGTLAGISGAGTTWTVTVNGIGGSGTLKLKLLASGTGIEDGAGNAASGGYSAGATHTVSFNAAPVIASNGGGNTAAFGIAEKQRAVTTVSASDAEGHPVSYSISGGADAALFEIDAATGVLRFAATPLRANALDSDHDNVYQLTVTAQDSLGASDSQNLSVTVLADLDGDGNPDASDDDIDNDGRPNSVEDPVPGAFGGTGDGNGDGIADSTQLNVASLPTVAQGTPFATLEVAPGLSLSSVSSIPAASGLPRNVKMPAGQFDFTIGGVTPGGTVQMSIYVDSALKVNGYYKKDAGGNWVNLAQAPVTVGSKTKLTFSLTDGGMFDSDGIANGSISDPGGLVTIAPAITSNGGAPSAALNLTEGQSVVTNVSAGAGASYAISGGADAALFQIDAATGALRFVNAPSYAAPGDAGANNVYDVEVTASDSFGSDTQALAIAIGALPPPVVETVVDGVSVGTGTRSNSDGSTSQVVTIPVVAPDRNETVGNNEVADIPLVSSGGKPVLSAQVPVGVGVQVSGNAAPAGVADSLTNLVREIKGVTAAGSHDQAQMTGGGSGFLSSLPQDANLMVQTVVPTVAPGTVTAGPLVINGAPSGAGGPLSALVIDAKGLPGGSTILLQNVDFAAIVGSVTVTGGAGKQVVWGDGASQTIMLGEDDDVLHGGAGNDSVGSAGGNDKVYGDEGDDLVFGGLGNDLVDGGTGYDTALFAGSGRADYSARFDNGHLVLTHRNGGADGTDTVANVEVLRFTGAAADAGPRGSIERLYEALLGRDADAAGVDAWLAAVGKGASLAEVARHMLAGSEAQQQAGSDAAFVSALYARSLERSVDAAGLQYWTDALASGAVTRAGLALAVTESAEKLAKPVSTELTIGDSDIGTLVRMYATLFDRAPDAAGMNHWLSLSEAGVSLDRIADHFLASSEALAAYGALDNQDFTQALYQHAMHRSGTAAEVSYWRGLLDSGRLDRGDVLLQFAESAEKVALVGVISSSLDGAGPV